jgi:hypothetical protein
MIVQFEILDTEANRILAVLPSIGFVYDAASAVSETQQKWDFFVQKTLDGWDSEVFNYERSLAIADEPNDTAAEQATRYVMVKDTIRHDHEKDWVANEELKIGQVRLSAGKRYIVVQDHTTQVGWEPANVPALFVEKPLPNDGELYPDWIQPTGAHDAYKIGDKVHYVPTDKNYESLINANVWSPEVYPAGWKEI